MLDKLKNLLVPPTATIREAVETIDRGNRRIALVVDHENRLLATITDGDIRRGLLRGVTLEDPLQEIMTSEPIFVYESAGRSAATLLMNEKSLHHIPILNADKQLVDLAWVDQLTELSPNNTHVVLMAGGLGTRLRPLTETMPKPMLPVGGRPLLEHIIQNFREQGFVNFIISLNYRGDMVRDYFEDGHNFGVKITYVDETERMGTAGALSLLPKRPDTPFIVMNGDLLTSVRFDALLRFHEETNATATMCAREYAMQVPYGVIRMKGTDLVTIEEKPTHTHFVNAGIYVLSPEALEYLEPGTPLDMPSLFERLVADTQTASVFPIQEYWMDIGRLEDLEQARSEFDTEFPK